MHITDSLCRLLSKIDVPMGGLTINLRAHVFELMGDFHFVII